MENSRSEIVSKNILTLYMAYMCGFNSYILLYLIILFDICII